MGRGILSKTGNIFSKGKYCTGSKYDREVFANSYDSSIGNSTCSFCYQVLKSIPASSIRSPISRMSNTLSNKDLSFQLLNQRWEFVEWTWVLLMPYQPMAPSPVRPWKSLHCPRTWPYFLAFLNWLYTTLQEPWYPGFNTADEVNLSYPSVQPIFTLSEISKMSRLVDNSALDSSVALVSSHNFLSRFIHGISQVLSPWQTFWYLFLRQSMSCSSVYLKFEIFHIWERFW